MSLRQLEAVRSASKSLRAKSLMKQFLSIFFVALVIAGSAFAVSAQQAKADSQADPFKEADAKHNLDVAGQYFRSKKAYRAVLSRFEETFVAYPEFTKIDEFIYLAALSSLYLSEGKGERAPAPRNDEERKKYSPDTLRENARAYFSMIVEKYPKSRFVTDAKSELKKNGWR